MTKTTLGIIAGQGDLPKQLIEACQSQNRPCVVVAFPGLTDPETVENIQHTWLPLGQVGQALDYFKQSQVQELVMAGAIRRPSWSEIRPDWRGAKLMHKLMTGPQGDDSILTAIIGELESEGFSIRGADEIIGNDILAAAGVLGQHSPSDQALQDIAYGKQVLKTIAGLDIGQAVTVQQGMVLGIEAIEGTTELIDRSGTVKRPGDAPVLVKMGKPQQDRRADLPTIGPDTIDQLHQAGFQGLAVETDTVQILDQAAVIAQADQHQLFIIGIQHD
ncbi:MAG: LpxI family protein [Alphaproteobacteria bacterium]